MDKSIKGKTIKLNAPSWEAVAKMHIMLLEDGNDEGKAEARRGITEMGTLIDQLIVKLGPDVEEIAGDAADAADKLHKEAGAAAFKQHNCRIYSRGFEFLSLDENGERDEKVIDYCDREEMDAEMIQSQIDDVRRSGSAYLAIGYGVDAAECKEAYDCGDYEPMFDWVDLPNVDVRI